MKGKWQRRVTATILAAVLIGTNGAADLSAYAQDTNLVSDMVMTSDMYSVVGDGATVIYETETDVDGNPIKYWSRTNFTTEVSVAPKSGYTLEYYWIGEESQEWIKAAGAVRISENGYNAIAFRVTDSRGQTYQELQFYFYIGPVAEFGKDFTVLTEGREIAAPTYKDGHYSWPEYQFAKPVTIKAAEGCKLYYCDYEEPVINEDGSESWPWKGPVEQTESFGNGIHSVCFSIWKDGVTSQEVVYSFEVGEEMKFMEQYTLSCGGQEISGLKEYYNDAMTLHAVSGYDLYVNQGDGYQRQEDGTFTASGEGHQNIDFYVIRKSGNVRYFSKVISFGIDKTKPTADLKLRYWDESGVREEACNSETSTTVKMVGGDAYVVIDASDSEETASGIQSVFYALTNQETDINSIPETDWVEKSIFEESVLLRSGWKNVLYVKVMDRAGNEAVYTSADVAVYYEPELSSEFYIAQKGSELSIPLEANGDASKVGASNEIESIKILTEDASGNVSAADSPLDKSSYTFDSTSEMLTLKSDVFSNADSFCGIRIKYKVPSGLSDCGIHTDGWVQDIEISVKKAMDVSKLQYVYQAPTAEAGSSTEAVFAGRSYSDAKLKVEGSDSDMTVRAKYYDESGHCYSHPYKAGKYTVKFDLETKDAVALNVENSDWTFIIEYPLTVEVRSDYIWYQYDEEDTEKWNHGDVQLSMEGYKLTAAETDCKEKQDALVVSKPKTEGAFSYTLSCKSSLSGKVYTLPITLKIDNLEPKLTGSISSVTDKSAVLNLQMDDVGTADIRLYAVNRDGSVADWLHPVWEKMQFEIAKANLNFSCNITGLAANTSYFVLVDAYDKVGHWAPADENSSYSYSYVGEVVTTTGGSSTGGSSTGGGSTEGGSTGGGSTGSGSTGGGSTGGGGAIGNTPAENQKPGSSIVETKTEVRSDGTKVETTTEVKPNGSKTEVVTETKPDGTKIVRTTNTKPDGSATVVVKEPKKNEYGKVVAVTTTTEKDAAGNIISVTKNSVIANAAADTNVTVTVATDSAKRETATAEIVKIGKKNSSGMINGTISSTVVKQIMEAAGTFDIKIVQIVTNANGTPRYTVEVNTQDLIAGEALKLMKLDRDTGEYVLCNAKNYYVSNAGGVSLSLKSKGDFLLLNAKDAKAASDVILKTVKVRNSSKTVAKGKTATVAMNSGLNMKNVSKITYTVSNKSVATVNKNGKVTAKKSGTVTVKAKVTLKNGKTRTVRMTIKVK